MNDAVTDHYPLLIEFIKSAATKDKLGSVWRRDISKMKASDFEAALGAENWSNIYSTDDPNTILDVILSNINLSLDKVAPHKLIKLRKNKPRLNLRKDTLAAMDARNKARKSGKKEKYKELRNIVTKLVKRDRIQTTLKHLGTNPSAKKAWEEAKTYLGTSQRNSLPECTNNKNPKSTADNQNKFFITKIEKLMDSIPSECGVQQHVASVHEGEKPFKRESCDYNSDLECNMQQHVASVHKGKKPFNCESCDYNSDLECDMQQHVAIVHEGKKPFNCESCEYSCKLKVDLQKHVASVHGDTAQYGHFALSLSLQVMCRESSRALKTQKLLVWITLVLMC